MKVYRVILDDGREEEVIADSYMADDEFYRFYANGHPIADIFFREDSVKGINVIADNHEDLYRWQGGGVY